MPLGEASAIAAALAWAVGSLWYGLIGRRTSAGAMNFGKLLTGVVVLGVAQGLWNRQVWPSSGSTWGITLLAISGLIGLAVGDTAYFGAIRSIGAPRAMLLLSGAPMLATLLGLFAGEGLTVLDGTGIVVTLAGIGLVIYRRTQGDSGHWQLGKGMLLGLLAALCQAVGAILARLGMKEGIDPLSASVVRLAVGLLGMLVVGGGSGQLRLWSRDLGQRWVWAKVAGAALVGTCIGVLLSLVALGRSRSVGVASTLLAMSPVFMLPLAHVCRVERATLRAFLGAVIAVAGVGLLAWK